MKLNDVGFSKDDLSEIANLCYLEAQTLTTNGVPPSFQSEDYPRYILLQRISNAASLMIDQATAWETANTYSDPITQVKVTPVLDPAAIMKAAQAPY